MTTKEEKAKWQKSLAELADRVNEDDITLNEFFWLACEAGVSLQYTIDWVDNYSEQEYGG